MIVALSGAIIANGVATPLYTASATIIVEPRQQKIVEFDSVLSALPVSLETMESEVQVIKSTTVARRVVDSLGLSTLAALTPALAPSEDHSDDDLNIARASWWHRGCQTG